MTVFLFFFWKAIKIAGSAQKKKKKNKKKKNRFGRVNGNIGILFRPYYDSYGFKS